MSYSVLQMLQLLIWRPHDMRCIFLCVLCIAFVSVLTIWDVMNNVTVQKNYIQNYTNHYIYSYRNISQQEKSNLSNLARYLFFGDAFPAQPEKNFTILIWKFGPKIHRRLIQSYTGVDKDPFENCSVKNCKIEYNDKYLNSSDAVMFHLHRLPGRSGVPSYRKPHQRWIFLSDESPYHTFMMSPKSKMRDFNGVFNWSMSYRMDSDVPVPYGRTVALSVPRMSLNVAANKTKFIAAMGSNCGGRNNRWDYIRKLSKIVPVDTFGRCGKLKCLGHYNKACPVLKQYKFYLAFENRIVRNTLQRSFGITPTRTVLYPS